jgi:lipoprotein-anchoring transpeptidase ErfK/SrfK
MLVDSFSNDDAQTQWIPTVTGQGVARQGVGSADATMALAPVKDFSQDGSEGSLEGAIAATKKSHKGRVAALIVLIAVVVILVAGFFVANWYFSSRVAPGVSFRGTSLTGKTKGEVQKVVEDVVESTRFDIQGDNGQSVSASYDSMGVAIDTSKTVSAIMNAKSDNMFTRINPFTSTTVSLQGTVDNLKLQKYLVSSLVPDSNKAVPSSVTYDSKAVKYVAKNGKIGKSPQIDAVVKAIKSSFGKVPAKSPVNVTITDIEQPISLATAQAAAKEANDRLANPIVVSNGQGGSFTIPAADIAKWTVVTSDPDKGTISVSYDADAIQSSLPQILAKALTQKLGDEQKIILPGGSPMVKTAGVPGVTVTTADATSAVGEVVDALNSNKKAAISVKSSTNQFSSSVVADYSKPNGDHWMKVNLSTQQAFAYAGSTLVKTFNVATGSLQHATPPGTFFVRAQLSIQTMIGEDYVTPDVPWISYFNGGVAFHGGYWDDGPGQQIEIGQPVSHGCVNMNVADAEWVYHFINVGSLVEVTGTTPDHAVRAPGAPKLPDANGSQS